MRFKRSLGVGFWGVEHLKLKEGVVWLSSIVRRKLKGSCTEVQEFLVKLQFGDLRQVAFCTWKK